MIREKEQIFFQDCSENITEDDQILINNKILKYSNYCALLDIEKFPNGYVYHTLGKKDKAIIVHNNHMVGIIEKINKFKENNLWYI